MSDLPGNSGQWIGLLETEDGKCPFCRQPAASYDYCCPAKARSKVEMMLTLKHHFAPPPRLSPIS